MKLQQYIPDGPPAMFTVLDPKPGENYWHVKIRDAIVGNEPEFRLRIPKKSKRPLTSLDIARKAAGQLNEARGLMFIQRFQNGVPVLTEVWASNPTVGVYRIVPPESTWIAKLAGIPLKEVLAYGSDPEPELGAMAVPARSAAKAGRSRSVPARRERSPGNGVQSGLPAAHRESAAHAAAPLGLLATGS